jgi:D-glycero-D-manno-heptose 1,7-bisphosphate phosphatase
VRQSLGGEQAQSCRPDPIGCDCVWQCSDVFYCFLEAVFLYNGQEDMNRAVFLDRDGTLIAEKHYLHKPEDVVVFPAAGPALARLQQAGFLLVIVSNQSGVGRGYFTLADVEAVNRRLFEELASYNVRFDRVYIAPEAPDQPSRGRKPSPQFLLDAQSEFDLELSRCYMIGDKLIDMQCGWNAGVGSCILVRTGYGARLEREAEKELARAVVASDLMAAADWILSSRASERKG